uniref:Proline rich acidic protein 1 n=2 Tax=Sus scrofa TaxID=9823 RepID=A0A4X1V4Z0_PIG
MALRSHCARLLLVTSLVAVLLLEAGSAPTPQALVKIKGKAGAEQDMEEAWSSGLVDPPGKDKQWEQLLQVASQEQQEGAKALAGNKDTLDRVPSPKWGPEPDRDHLYHSWPQEAQEEARPWARALPPRQVLQGPEEDRDHIYHPRGDSWEP